MSKTTAPSKRGRGARDKSKQRLRQEKIETTIAALDDLKPTTAMAAGAIALLKSWLSDESGYDEKTWPRLKDALEQDRKRVGARSLFDA